MGVFNGFRFLVSYRDTCPLLFTDFTAAAVAPRESAVSKAYETKEQSSSELLIVGV